MIYSIVFFNGSKNSNPILKIKTDFDDLNDLDFKLHNEKMGKVRGVVFGVLCPIRTNTVKNFIVDVFLPTTINYTIKINKSVKRVFAVLGSIILDTMTLPVRLLTCIPRMIFNPKKEDNKIFQAFKQRGINKEILEHDALMVDLCYGGPHTAQRNFIFIDLPRVVVYPDLSFIKHL